MIIPYLCHIALVLEIECHEILYIFNTTRDIEVGIIRQCEILEHLFLPINVRIAFCLTIVTEIYTIGIIVRLYFMILITEVIDECLRTIVCP